MQQFCLCKLFVKMYIFCASTAPISCSIAVILMNSFSSSPIFSPFIISSAFFKTLRVCSMPKGISLNTSLVSIIIFYLNINCLHLYLIGVFVLSIHFFVGRYNQHHGTAHFILHPRNIHHVFRRLRLHNMIYYKTI